MNTQTCARATTAARTVTLFSCFLLALTPGCDTEDGNPGATGATTGTVTGSDDSNSSHSGTSADEGADDGPTDDGPTDDGPTDDGPTDDGPADDGTGTTGPDDGTTTDAGGDTTGTSTGGTPGIAIEGQWVETYAPDGMVTHTIDAVTWTLDDSQFGPFSYALASFDNATQTAIGDDGAGFAKLQWTWTDGDTQLWYCTAAFGAQTAEAAAASPDADATDPENGGCGGFNWSALAPL